MLKNQTSYTLRPRPAKTQAQPLKPEYRTLINIRLNENVTQDAFDEFRTRFASSDITVQTTFESPNSSALLIVTLSIEVWTMLPLHETAYNLTSFIKDN
jgi:hypothetical protein